MGDLDAEILRPGISIGPISELTKTQKSELQFLIYLRLRVSRERHLHSIFTQMPIPAKLPNPSDGAQEHSLPIWHHPHT